MLASVLLFAAVAGTAWWARRAVRRRVAGVACAGIPVDDRPPPSAVGWPPDGAAFTAYVDQGFAAIDAYLSQGHAA